MSHEREARRIARSSLARRPRWLITRYTMGQMEVRTVGIEDDEVLPVFSFEEEARMYLRLRAEPWDEDWRVRETSVGELVSVLHGPCARVIRVALDPLPEVCGGAPDGLLSVRRDDFVLALLNEEPSTPRCTNTASGQGSTGLVTA
jgi:hypothetical protein